MKCLICGTELENTYVCPKCGRTNSVAKKIIYSSNWHYNQGLAKANIRDLSGAAVCLRTSLEYNKRNTRARNLLGLVYYQTGEIVDALSEWVISVHFQPEGNAASGYLKTIQDNPALFAEAGKIIKKYNTALEYIAQGSNDMAILELKKAVSLNPKYVRAYQLLALLYMQREQYAAARKALIKAVKVDRNNMTTMRYLKEVNQHYKKPDRTRQASAVRISDPTPIVIEKKTEKNYREYNTGFISFINIIIGIVIGAAVVWLLIVPSVTKSSRNQYNDAVVEYSAQLSERNKEISSLQTQVDSLQKSLSEYESTVGSTVNDDGVSSGNLQKAILNYLQDDLTAAGNAVADIDPDAITDDTQKDIYKALVDATKDAVTPTLYANAEASYENGDYTEAVDGFKKVLRMDSTYTAAIYYLARSYHRAGDLVNAAVYYQQIVQNYPDSDYASDAQQYLNRIDQTAGSSVTNAASAQNETETETETETESDTSSDYSSDDSGDYSSDYSGDGSDNSSDYSGSDDYSSDYNSDYSGDADYSDDGENY